MKVIVDEKIEIQDYTQEVFSYFRKKLTFQNPEYWKKIKMNRWVGNTPPEITLYERHGTSLIIPFGELPSIFANKEVFGRIENSLKVRTEKADFGSNISPYDYQEPAIKKALKDRQGVIVAPCGAGKTQIGLEISARIGKRTLWLTHTMDLLNQSMNRAKQVFDLKDEDYGTITGGKIDLGNCITFATVQTMSKIDLTSIKNYFDVIIVDECHHAVGTPTKLMMFYKVVSSLCARYKFGLTATPDRADGLTPCMYALIGPKIYEIPREAVKEKSCQVKVKMKWTEYEPQRLSDILMPDGTLSYVKLLQDIVSNQKRNELIIDDVCNSGGTSLILTDRISHIGILRNMLIERGVSCETITGAQSKKEERKKAIAKLNNKEIQVLIATFQLAKEGLDIPSLDNVFFATPQKNPTIVTQASGRVARQSLGKEIGIVHDYVDNFGLLMGWAKKRGTIYEKLNYKIGE